MSRWFSADGSVAPTQHSALSWYYNGMAATNQRPPPRKPSRPGERARPGTAAVVASQAAMLTQDGWARVRQTAAARWIGRAAAVLFVLALPLALIGTNVRVLFTTPPLYRYVVDRYRVPEITGIPKMEIDRAMTEIRDYFRNDQRLLRITVTDNLDRSEPLFTPREVMHMRDVKVLVQGIFQAQTLAVGYCLLYVASALAIRRRAAWPGLARLTRGATRGTLAFAVLFGATTLLGFDRLFEQFHVLSFSNDLWLLDPTQDHLVQMFPFGFWLNSTVVLVGMTIIELLVLLSVSWAYLQRRARTEQVG